MTEQPSGELRWNPLAHRWVAVAGHRSARPVDGPPAATEPERPARDPACPFCPGNEHETLPAVATLPADDGDFWELRVVPNKVYQGLAAGTVVITSDTLPQRRLKATYELNSLRLVPPGDVAALRNELVRLAQQKRRIGPQVGIGLAETSLPPACVVAPLAARLHP